MRGTFGCLHPFSMCIDLSLVGFARIICRRVFDKVEKRPGGTFVSLRERANRSHGGLADLQIFIGPGQFQQLLLKSLIVELDGTKLICSKITQLMFWMSQEAQNRRHGWLSNVL